VSEQNTFLWFQFQKKFAARLKKLQCFCSQFQNSSLRGGTKYSALVATPRPFSAPLKKIVLLVAITKVLYTAETNSVLLFTVPEFSLRGCSKKLFPDRPFAQDFSQLNKMQCFWEQIQKFSLRG
jgi:hypothetical protein